MYFVVVAGLGVAPVACASGYEEAELDEPADTDEVGAGTCQPIGGTCDPDDPLHGTPDLCCSGACEQDRASGVTRCVVSGVRYTE